MRVLPVGVAVALTMLFLVSCMIVVEPRRGVVTVAGDGWTPLSPADFTCGFLWSGDLGGVRVVLSPNNERHPLQIVVFAGKGDGVFVEWNGSDDRGERPLGSYRILDPEGLYTPDRVPRPLHWNVRLEVPPGGQLQAHLFGRGILTHNPVRSGDEFSLWITLHGAASSEDCVGHFRVSNISRGARVRLAGH